MHVDHMRTRKPTVHLKREGLPRLLVLYRHDHREAALSQPTHHHQGRGRGHRGARLVATGGGRPHVRRRLAVLAPRSQAGVVVLPVSFRSHTWVQQVVALVDWLQRRAFWWGLAPLCWAGPGRRGRQCRQLGGRLLLLEHHAHFEPGPKHLWCGLKVQTSCGLSGRYPAPETCEELSLRDRTADPASQPGAQRGPRTPSIAPKRKFVECGNACPRDKLHEATVKATRVLICVMVCGKPTAWVLANFHLVDCCPYLHVVLK